MSDGHERPALEKRDTAQNPTSDNRVSDAIGAVHEFLALAERQVIQECRQETVPAGIRRIAVIKAGIEGVAELVTEFAGKAIGAAAGSLQLYWSGSACMRNCLQIA